MKVELLDVRKKPSSSYTNYYIKITGKFGNIDFDSPDTYFACYTNLFTAEYYPHVKNSSNGWRLPGLEQIGPDLPYPEPYWSLCKEVGDQIKNIELKKTLTPKTAKTFNDLIDEL
jgi:hypothetical protein